MIDRLSVEVYIDDIHKDEVIQLPNDLSKVKDWIKIYKRVVWATIKKEKRNYIRYLSKKEVNDKDCIVDTGFYGSIQNGLCVLLKQDIRGLYFNCDLTGENVFHKNKMYPCFQDKNDKDATKNQLRRWPQLVESMFTAPYGMIMRLDDNGEKECAPDGINQKYFDERIKINNGIKEFISDMWMIRSVFNQNDVVEKRMLADGIFGFLMKSSQIECEIKKAFAWDDNLVQRREDPIFS